MDTLGVRLMIAIVLQRTGFLIKPKPVTPVSSWSEYYTRWKEREEGRGEREEEIIDTLLIAQIKYSESTYCFSFASNGDLNSLSD